MTIFDAAGVGLSLLWNAAAVAQTSATGELGRGVGRRALPPANR
jgi:hypothetical protein